MSDHNQPPDLLDYLQDENLYVPSEIPLLEALVVWSGFGETVETETDT